MPASTMQLNLEAVTGLTGVRAGAWQRWQRQVGQISMPSNGGLRGSLALKK